MPRSALGMDGTTDDLPVHMKRARGIDRKWVMRSKCRTPGVLGELTRFASDNEDERQWRRRAWTVDESDGIVIIAGRKVPAAEVEQACVSVCRSCPVQGDCIAYAIVVQEKCGTWAAPFTSVRWLQRNPDRQAEVLLAWDALEIPVADSIDYLMALG